MFSQSSTFFLVNIIRRIAGQLRSIILLHFGLITFRIHYRKTVDPLIFMVLGPGGRDHKSQNQYYLSLETPGHSKIIQEKIPNIFKHMSWGNLRTGDYVIVLEMRVPHILKIVIKHLVFGIFKVLKLSNFELEDGHFETFSFK